MFDTVGSSQLWDWIVLSMEQIVSKNWLDLSFVFCGGNVIVASTDILSDFPGILLYGSNKHILI